jgi:hypothetical protein
MMAFQDITMPVKDFISGNRKASVIGKGSRNTTIKSGNRFNMRSGRNSVASTIYKSVAAKEIMTRKTVEFQIDVRGQSTGRQI